MKQRFRRFFKNEEGATVVEYAVMLVLIVIVAIVTIGILGRKVNNGFKLAADLIPS